MRFKNTIALSAVVFFALSALANISALANESSEQPVLPTDTTIATSPLNGQTTCATVLATDQSASPSSLAELLNPQTYRSLPPLLEHEILLANLTSDAWVLTEQNLNKPTYANMQPTKMVIPPADSHFRRRLEIRRQIYAEYPDEVFITTAAKQFKTAAQEILDLTIQAYTGPNGPYIAQTDADGTVISLKDKATGEVILVKDSHKHPLLLAGLLGGTDWIVMKFNKSSNDYVVAGGFVASPYRYNLKSQISKSLTEIHEGMTYKTQPTNGTKPMKINLAQMVSHLMRRLGEPGPNRGRALTRPAWFITDSPALSQHLRKQEPIVRDLGTEYFEINRSNYPRNIFLRVEREVMFALTTPTENYLVFGLYPYTFTLEQLGQNAAAAAKIYEGLQIDPDRSVSEEHTDFVLRYLRKALTQ